MIRYLKDAAALLLLMCGVGVVVQFAECLVTK